ncbi:hypothetical protein [Hymenobacter canadensis]|uniref:Lipocalin-like domain-containing protein n=1 Tax=Hymenobacter canadensis TaxID=2999067 RepID=A0ABY7LW19_9BACT|nr:hypothetical protein [Hymenobacter canadensis]WBA43794.1 hypothetical protein O3303_09550 [Hymenobacter canadensis]
MLIPWLSTRRVPVLFGCLTTLLLLLTAAGTAQAQAPLTGRWSLRQIAFEAPATLPDSLQEKLFHSPAAETNIGISNGELTLVVEFRPDSTYTYTTTRGGRLVLTEQGTYSVRRNQLYTRSSQTTDDPLFNGQLLLELTRRKLLLQTPIWQPELQIFEQLEYVRLPAKK